MSPMLVAEAVHLDEAPVFAPPRRGQQRRRHHHHRRPCEGCTQAGWPSVTERVYRHARRRKPTLLTQVVGVRETFIFDHPRLWDTCTLSKGSLASRFSTSLPFPTPPPPSFSSFCPSSVPHDASPDLFLHHAPSATVLRSPVRLRGRAARSRLTARRVVRETEGERSLKTTLCATVTAPFYFARSIQPHSLLHKPLVSCPIPIPPPSRQSRAHRPPVCRDLLSTRARALHACARPSKAQHHHLSPLSTPIRLMHPSFHLHLLQS